MHWQVVDDMPGPVASVETESTGPHPSFNVDQAAFKSLNTTQATCHLFYKSDSRLRTDAASVDAGRPLGRVRPCTGRRAEAPNKSPVVLRTELVGLAKVDHRKLTIEPQYIYARALNIL